MLVLPSERDAQRLSDADERRRRELASVRICETDEEERAVNAAARERLEERLDARRMRQAPTEVAAPTTPVAAEIATAVEDEQCRSWVARAERHTLAHEATASNEEADLAVLDQDDAHQEVPMAKEEQRLCDVCHETPLRSNNRSGMCTACRLKPKREAANGHANGVAKAPAPAAEELHACDPRLLSDEDLARCIAEARERIKGRDRLAELLAAPE